MTTDELKLPDRLSDVLELALKDLANCEAQPSRFSIRMYDWVVSRPRNGTCTVCLAGSVIVGTLDALTEEKRLSGLGFCPYDFDLSPLDSDRLYALNMLREGRVDEAVRLVTGRLPEVDLDRDVAEYHSDREAWWADMVKVIEDLRSHGF